jgi:hypothetical protein
MDVTRPLVWYVGLDVLLSLGACASAEAIIGTTASGVIVAAVAAAARCRDRRTRMVPPIRDRSTMLSQPSGYDQNVVPRAGCEESS